MKNIQSTVKNVKQKTKSRINKATKNQTPKQQAKNNWDKNETKTNAREAAKIQRVMFEKHYRSILLKMKSYYVC